MSTSKKTGPLTAAEKAHIRANVDRPAAEIATEMGRTVEAVERYLREARRRPEVAETAAEQTAIREELRQSEEWKSLAEEFTRGELKFFEEKYLKLMGQFKGDVLPSEETQIAQAAKFEILMSRNLRERRKLREDIERLEEMQADFLAPFNGDTSQMTDDQKQLALSLTGQLNTMRSAEQGRTVEYVKLQERHASLMDKLKASRDQRISRVESDARDFLSVIRGLQDRKRREETGQRVALMAESGKQSLEKLSRPVKYEDGTLDSPILAASEGGTTEDPLGLLGDEPDGVL